MARRSPRITLTVIASVTAVSLAACGDDPQSPGAEAPAPQPAPVTMFADAAACAEQLTQAECAAAVADAKEQHERNAPRFVDRNNCESFSGAPCTLDRWGEAFLPAMAGFMVARAIAGQPAQVMPLHSGPSPECQRRPGADQGASPRQDDCRSAGRGVGRYFYSGSHYWGHANTATDAAASTRAGATGAAALSRTSQITPGPPIAPGARSSGGYSRTPSAAAPSSSSVSRGGIGSIGRSMSTST